MRPLPALALAVLLAGCFDRDLPTAREGGPQVELQPFISGLAQPTFLTHAGDGSGRLYVVEQAGRVRMWADGRLEATPFLDIHDRVGSGGERGLLGLAFDPAFEDNGRFYVHYTDLGGDTVLSRFTAVGPLADPSSEEILLQATQPYPNHNGGWIAFGPDGSFYMALGDGGGSGDPEGNGQDRESILGKILRLDVSGEEAVAAEGNPFAGEAGDDRVWAYGLRNPWRSSFDRETGDLWIADVGQQRYEEVDFQPAGSQGGENYGWSVYEGSQRYRQSGSAPGHVRPVAEYDHDGNNCSVTGGYVYRGPGFPSLEGVYFFADYCSGTMWSLEKDGDGWTMGKVLETGLNVSSFGEDEAGEVYVVHHGGAVFRLVAA